MRSSTARTTQLYRDAGRLLAITGACLLLVVAATAGASVASASADGVVENDTATAVEPVQTEIDPGPHPADDDRERVRAEGAPWSAIALVDPPNDWASFYPDDDEGGYATGFLVEPDVVVTAGHVADPPNGGLSEPEHEASDIRIAFGAHTGGEPVERHAEEIWLPERYSIGTKDDVAVVKLSEPVDGPTFDYAAVGEGEFDRTDTLHTAGYPASAEKGSLWTDSGEFADQNVTDDVQRRQFEASLAGSNGHSGSPVWTETGETYTVIGLVLGATPTDTESNFLVERWLDKIDELSGGSPVVDAAIADAPTVLAAGENVTVDVDVENRGSGAASVPLALSIGDETLTQATVEIDAEAQRTVELTGTTEVNRSHGPVELSVDADTDAAEATVRVVSDCVTIADGTVCDVGGDESYRDVNGDGDVSNGDVVDFFGSQHVDPWNQRTDLFDFDGNGDVGQSDVVALFEHVSDS